LHADAQQRKGEFVVLLKGVDERDKHALDPDAERILKILLEELSVKQASELAAKITGVSKKALYQSALHLK
jgi:16S rRNA (cytidine1402-2'-O)-methyltransferase